MSTFTDRPQTALLVVDVQNDVVAGAHDRDGVVANIAQLVARARTAEVPVVWIQHESENLVPGTPGWDYVPELEAAQSEPVVHKRYGDAFEDTDLADVLAQHAVGRVVVTGAQSDACVRSTIHGAFTRGYDTVLVADAHTTEDLTEYGAPPPAGVIAHTNLYWRFQDAPGRDASVVDTADVDFA